VLVPAVRLLLLTVLLLLLLLCFEHRSAVRRPWVAGMRAGEHARLCCTTTSR
jgi:hypothetical protein